MGWKKKVLVAVGRGVVRSGGGWSGVAGFECGKWRVQQHPAGVAPRQELRRHATANPTPEASVKADGFDNVQKQLGEEAGLIDEKTRKSYFTFEVATAQLLDSCPSRMGGPKLRPTRSHFLVLDVETELKEQVGEKTGGNPEELFMPLVTDAFSVIDADGKIDGE